VERSEASARFVKARLERTTLGQVARSVRIVLSSGQAHVEVALDMAAISELQVGGRVGGGAPALWPAFRRRRYLRVPSTSLTYPCLALSTPLTPPPPAPTHTSAGH
jgi:hypothetical protein